MGLESIISLDEEKIDGIKIKMNVDEAKVGEKKNQRIPLFLSTCSMCIECGGTFI
jgi:hypothetical protein